MRVKFPLSFRSQSTWALIFFMFLVGLITLEYYVPKDPATQYEVAAGALGVLGVGIGYSIIGSRLKGPPKPHAVVTGRFYPSGVSQQRDFFFGRPDPVKRMVDTVYLGEINDKSGEEVPEKFQGRDIFPYVARTHWPVSWDEMGNYTVHIFVLHSRWEEFFGHYERPLGAYVLGEVIDHGNSDCVVVYVAPFVHRFLDQEIPIYYGVEGACCYKKITRSWQPTMRAIARMDMERVLRDYKDELWPKVEIDEIVEKRMQKKKEAVAAVIARST